MSKHCNVDHLFCWVISKSLELRFCVVDPTHLLVSLGQVLGQEVLVGVYFYYMVGKGTEKGEGKGKSRTITSWITEKQELLNLQAEHIFNTLIQLNTFHVNCWHHRPASTVWSLWQASEETIDQEYVKSSEPVGARLQPDSRAVRYLSVGGRVHTT